MLDCLVVLPLTKFELEILYIVWLRHIDHVNNNFRILMGGSVKSYRRIIKNEFFFENFSIFC